MHKPILEQSHLLGANNEIQIIIIFIFVVKGEETKQHSILNRFKYRLRSICVI